MLFRSLVRSLWGTKRQSLRLPRAANGILLLQLIALLFVLLLHLMPGVVQQNQPWMLLALPIWLALAWTLRQRKST